MADFDPSGVGIANGNIFGFPVEENNAKIVLIPVPWDVTASYGKGTSRGPEQILEASTQLDFYHPKLKDAHKTPVFMLPISREGLKMNDELVLKTMNYIDFYPLQLQNQFLGGSIGIITMPHHCLYI